MAAPNVFDQSAEDGRVLLLTVSPETEHEDAAREAISLCPSGALSFCEGDDGVDPARAAANGAESSLTDI